MSSIKHHCRKVVCIGRNYAYYSPPPLCLPLPSLFPFFPPPFFFLPALPLIFPLSLSFLPPPFLTHPSPRHPRSDHITELNNTRPPRPFFFLKPPSSILPPARGPVWRPRGVELHYEVELGIVIGRQLGGVWYDEVAKEGRERRIKMNWDRWMDFVQCEFFFFWISVLSTFAYLVEICRLDGGFGDVRFFVFFGFGLRGIGELGDFSVAFPLGFFFSLPFSSDFLEDGGRLACAVAAVFCFFLVSSECYQGEKKKSQKEERKRRTTERRSLHISPSHEAQAPEQETEQKEKPPPPFSSMK